MPDRRTDKDKEKPPDKPAREPQFPIIESTSGSQRRSDSPQVAMDVDFDAIFDEIVEEWSVQPRVHVPMHRTSNCEECRRFGRHIIDYTRGGGHSHFVSIQREHWKEELRNEFDAAYKDGLKEGRSRINDLYDEIDDLKRHYNDLKEENARLRLSAESTRHKRERPFSGEGRPSEREEPSRQKKSRTEESKTSKEKGKKKALPGDEEEPPKKKREMYDDIWSSDDYMSDERNDEDDLGEQLDRARHQEREEADRRAAHPFIPGQAAASSSSSGPAPPIVPPNAPPTAEHSTYSSTTYSHALIDRIGSGVRSTNPDQRPPGPTSDRIRGPARFNLQGWRHAKCHRNGHVSVLENTYWGEDASKLWGMPNRYWASGRPRQLVREASMVPFDQRSSAQRWVVRTATNDGVLPSGTLSREPDMENEATLASASQHLRTDSNNRFYVEDITVWLFLIMTQPEERERTVEWFWYLACALFSRRGEFDEVLRGFNRNGNDEGRNYTPWRFVHKGRWSVEELANHFYNCGLRSRQANTLFYEFAMRWMSRLSAPPAEPDWDALPAPRELYDRTKAHKANVKQRKFDRAKRDAPEISLVYGVASPPRPTPLPSLEARMASPPRSSHAPVASMSTGVLPSSQEPPIDYTAVDQNVEESMPVDGTEDPPTDFDGDKSRM